MQLGDECMFITEEFKKYIDEDICRCEEAIKKNNKTV